MSKLKKTISLLKILTSPRKEINLMIAIQKFTNRLLIIIYTNNMLKVCNNSPKATILD